MIVKPASLITLSSFYNDHIFFVLEMPNEHSDLYTVRKIWDLKLSVQDNVSRLHKKGIESISVQYPVLISKSVHYLIIKAMSGYVCNKVTSLIRILKNSQLEKHEYTSDIYRELRPTVLNCTRLISLIKTIECYSNFTKKII